MKKASWGIDEERFDAHQKLYGEYVKTHFFKDEESTYGHSTDHLCIHKKCIGQVTVYYDVIGYHVFLCQKCVDEKLNNVRTIRESIGPVDFNATEEIRKMRGE